MKMLELSIRRAATTGWRMPVAARVMPRVL